MNEILQDLSTPSLIHAIENNLFEMLTDFRRWPKAEIHEETTILWNFTDIPFPLFNNVMRAQLAPERIDSIIQSMIAQARTRNVSLLWWTGPQTSPQDLGKRLEEHGFVDAGDMPGMAVKLADMKENLLTPPGFHIQCVTDQSTLNLWCEMLGKVFHFPDFAIEAYYDLINHVNSEQMQAYLGWLDGKPVATSFQYLAAGVAGIYNVTTIPEARKQGIGAAMTVFPLLEARARGYQAGILEASEMGAGVYRSLGFQELCRIGQYVYRCS